MPDLLFNSATVTFFLLSAAGIVTKPAISAVTIKLFDDVLEATDSDGDGLYDYQDPDADNDGIVDLFEAPNGVVVDTDNDGTNDHLDTDSDGDGIPDSEEDTTSPTLLGTDADNDGIDDALDTDLATGDTDDNANGVGDSLEPLDTDGDGIIDERDPDADGDGFADVQSDGSGSPRMRITND